MTRNKSNFFKDLLDFPGIMLYILCKSFISPMLWGLILMAIIVLIYVVITG
jgi:hypothetical protein